MNDTQILTLALSVIIPLSFLIYSNSRITEAKETLRADIAALKAVIQADIAEVKHAVQIHELEHHGK